MLQLNGLPLSLIASLGMPGHAWQCSSKITSSIRRFNFITPTVFDMLKLKNSAIWLVESIFAFNHAHLKLHYQFAALIDMKLHAQNQLYTSISFRDIKVLKASLGMPGHAWPHPPKFITLIDMKLHAQKQQKNQKKRFQKNHKGHYGALFKPQKYIHQWLFFFFFCKIQKPYFWALHIKWDPAPLRHPNFMTSFRNTDILTVMKS